MILHDYPDDKATALLKITAEAMTTDSVLIIDELVIPNKGAHGHATQFDMIMMSSLSSVERTDKQWEALLESAGFEILEKKAYAPTGESVIAVRPKA
jgi:demethylsterigmatocystin 6-O-methyltransferase